MAARAVVRRPEQGWSLLCNGVVLFEDAGELLPDGRAVPPPAATVLTMDARAGMTPAAALAQRGPGSCWPVVEMAACRKDRAAFLLDPGSKVPTPKLRGHKCKAT
jgi:hypothetical protein